MTTAQDRIIQLFEKHRATPAAPYDESHFLDFLVAEPAHERAVYNSFRGLRRFNAFIDDVQLEFAVCFSTEDRDANYSLQRFVHRAIELQASRRGSLKSLNNQIKAGPGWHVLVIADLGLLVLATWAKGSVWAVAALCAFAALVNLWFCRFTWRAKAYLLRLRARIEAAGEKRENA
jgi:hypothetical protein